MNILKSKIKLLRDRIMLGFFPLAFATNVCAQAGASAATSGAEADGEETDAHVGHEEVDELQTLPNVILMMTDDQGWGDFGVHGNSVIETPNLDAMSKRSVSWESFYVSPVCTPTRASVMTGRYNQRTKALDTYLGRAMMASDEVTIAEALNGAGYATGIFGKWHLGDNYPMRPSDQGFEYSLVHRGGGLGQPSDPIANNGRYTDPILFRNNEEVQTKGYCTDIYFDEAIDFITRSSEYQRPFFAYIATNAPHAPFHDVPAELLEYYQKKDFSSVMKGDDAKELDKVQRIAAMITNVDENVGKLFKVLEEKKLLENTLVIYLNDNGPNTGRFNGVFKGQKADVYEGGVRSPLWIHWPSKLKGGTKITSNNAAHIDIMPTIMEACDMGTPDAFKFDGRSLFGKVLDPDLEMEARPIVIQCHRGATMVKNRHFMVRDGKWKLVCDSGFGSTTIKEELPFELYDMSADPGETKDVAGENAAEVLRLTGIYNKWFDDVSETRVRDKGTPYILVDRAKENPVVLTWQDRISKGWGIKDQGFWKLFFQSEAMVDVRVLAVPERYKQDLKGYTVVLQVGKTEYKSEPVGGQQLAVFQSVVVPKGKTQVQAKYVSADGAIEVPAYQLRVMHR